MLLSKRTLACKFLHCNNFYNRYSSAANKAIPNKETFVLDKSHERDLKMTRNIGIIAHIDAGKTTTTERFLYYSGMTRKLGDVDSGDTVTDYLPQERQRGITITSAAITFGWHSPSDPQSANNKSLYKINLIDTPGHIDFTMEVERSLRVLDSAVIVLDAVAGVQAQTRTVFLQAKRYNLPCLAFLNKMDRIGASFEDSIDSMKRELGIIPLPLQVPLLGHDQGRNEDSETDSAAIIDLISMRKIVWSLHSGKEDGKDYQFLPITESSELRLLSQARRQMIEQICEFDDDLMESVISLEEENSDDNSVIPYASLDGSVIVAAIKRGVSKNSFVPTLLGASFRNWGVQPLLDAVVSYLPNPLERPYPHVYSLAERKKVILPPDSRGPLVLLAFKVQQHGPTKQILTFVRIYSGTLKPNSSIVKLNRAHASGQDSVPILSSAAVKPERVGKVYQMYADSLEEIPHATPGNIAVLMGLKDSCTGDTFIQMESAGSSSRKVDEQSITRRKDAFLLEGIPTPPSVFTRALIANIGSGKSEQDRLASALALLQREDPSCRVEKHPETGQTLISGMGELHLEILLDRLVKGYFSSSSSGAGNGEPLELGQQWIAYRESLINDVPSELVFYDATSKKVTRMDVSTDESTMPSGFLVDFKLDKTNLSGKRLRLTATFLLTPSQFPNEEEVETIYTDAPKQEWDSLVNDCFFELKERLEDVDTKASVSLFQGKIEIPLVILTNVLVPIAKGRQVIDIPFDPSNPTLCKSPISSKKELIECLEKDEKLFKALLESLLALFERGPLLGYPLLGLKVTLISLRDLQNQSGDECTPNTFEQSMRQAFSLAMNSFLNSAICRKEFAAALEPCLHLKLIIPSHYAQEITNDLSKSRRATITSSNSIVLNKVQGSEDGEQGYHQHHIEAIVPISTMSSYSSHVRRLCKGSVDVELKYLGCRRMNSALQLKWQSNGGTLEQLQ